MALSSTEAEYISISNAAREVIYLKTLLKELEGAEDTAVVIHVYNKVLGNWQTTLYSATAVNSSI